MKKTILVSAIALFATVSLAHAKSTPGMSVECKYATPAGGGPVNESDLKPLPMKNNNAGGRNFMAEVETPAKVKYLINGGIEDDGSGGLLVKYSIRNLATDVLLVNTQAGYAKGLMVYADDSNILLQCE